MTDSSRIRQVLLFLLFGGLSALIDGGVFLLLTHVGTPPPLASAIGFMSAFVVNYSGNRRVVFRAKEGSGYLWRYVVIVLVNLGLSAGLVALGVAVGLHPTVAKVISIVIIAVLNFIAMRQWVFRDRTTQAG